MSFKHLYISILLTAGSLFSTAAQQPIEIDSPQIKVFLPDSIKTGKAVIACPGGGYHALAQPREGNAWADFFNSRGIALISLNYKMPDGNPQIPIRDVEETMRLVKFKSSDWGINPDSIGVMGSSAGGHLAAMLATTDDDSLRPAFQILFYPVITMDSTYTNLITRKNLLGKNHDISLDVEFSPEKKVTKKTPPAWIVFSYDDDTVSLLNGTEYFNALYNKGVPAEMHIYPSGSHGWGFNQWKYHDRMLNDLSEWIKTLK